MASFVAYPGGGGPGGYVIPKRRNPLEEKEKGKRGTNDDTKSTASSGVLDREPTSTSTSAAHLTHNRTNVWTGSLKFEDQTVESVDLYSPFRNSAKPTGFSSSLDIKLLLTSADCQRYPPLAELLDNTRTHWHGILLHSRHVFVCLPRSSPSSSSSSSSSTNQQKTSPMQASYFFLTNTFSPLFARIYDRLKSKEIAAMSVLADDTVLFLLPEGKLTERLGIPLHDKPVFHCIFFRPRPEIIEDMRHLGWLMLDHHQAVKSGPTPHDKLDGETLLDQVDKYRRTCGLPIAKRSAVSPLNTLLSPGKPPPGGKPLTPYIPTPGSTAAQRSNTYGYHKRDDWQAFLQPPPPPPPMSLVQTGPPGTPRGILCHPSGAAGVAGPLSGHQQKQPTSLFKNVMQQVRKINEESKTVPTPSESVQPSIPPLPPLNTPPHGPPLLPPPPPPPALKAATTDGQQLPPSVSCNLTPSDPRLLRHTKPEDPRQHQRQQQQSTTDHKASVLSHKINQIPVDPRPNAAHSPPSDPRLKRKDVPLSSLVRAPPAHSSSGPIPPPSLPSDDSISKTAMPVLNVVQLPHFSSTVLPPPFNNSSAATVIFKPTPAPPPMPNLGFKRAYGLVGMDSSTAAAADGVGAPPGEKKKILPQDIASHQHEQLHRLQRHQFGASSTNSKQQQRHESAECFIHNESDEALIGGDIPMEIDDDDRPYSPSQASPPPTQANDGGVDRDEYLEDEEEDDDTAEEHGGAIGESSVKAIKNVKVEHDENEKAEHERKEQRMGKERNGEMERIKIGEGEKETGGRASPNPSDAGKTDEVGMQSPISLVRSLVPSPLPKSSPKSERRRVKMPTTAAINASGFGFDFLNWNSSTDSSAIKESQLNSSSSSSNSSSVLRTDETFNVEELLKQAEISVANTNNKSTTTKTHNEAEANEDNDLRENGQRNEKEEKGPAEATENNMSPSAVGLTAPPPLPPVVVPSSSIKPLSHCLQHQQMPSPPPRLMALPVLVPTPPPPHIPLMPNAGAAAIVGDTNNNTDALNGKRAHCSQFASTTPISALHTPSPPVASVRPFAPGGHPSYRMHRLDVPPPVLHMPPPPVIRTTTTTPSTTAVATADSTDKKMSPSCCTAIALLDPEMIMCYRIKLNELRDVLVAAQKNAVLVLWHQMITDRLIEVGIKAKPFLALMDEFVAGGTVERMGTHQCDKNGLDFPTLLACSFETAARERQNRGKPKLRVFFLSVMIKSDSEEASEFGANQIDVLNIGQFVEMTKGWSSSS